MGMFGGPLYCYFAKRLYFIVLFARRLSSLLINNQVCYSHYLFQKESLCPKVLTFFIDLLLYNRYNTIFTFVDRLTKYCTLILYLQGREL